ncbi:hypothetical protein DdX_12243 [Ditylenchus destructor]|uniref:Uncharacterized protein n=1 Tax=Ditylenchus destructor TaxID=166010 RepID=A0AAD4MYH6_9BILA|nr:hypothetical protein DdX_12243 [Ditylenchus destructor]
MNFLWIAFVLISVLFTVTCRPLSGDSLQEGAVSSGTVGQQSLDKLETRHPEELEAFVSYSERRFNGNR